jgi:Secretion system C-terminal sorting domain/YadA head domain repeat (2 copies)
MKKLHLHGMGLSTLILVLCLINTTSTQAQNCMQCEGDTASGYKSTALGLNSNAIGDYSFSAGRDNLSGGHYSFSMGYSSVAYGGHSFALGRYCSSLDGSYSFGDHAICRAGSAMALGHYVQSNASQSITIGSTDNEHPLINNIVGSLMIGFKSSYPTFFVGPTPVGEETGFVGIGTSDPKAKLQVSGGNIYLEEISAGIIMRSPDGSCWKLTVANNGEIQSEAVECGQLQNNQEISSDKPGIEIYPNPANDRLNIKMEKQQTQPFDLFIFNINGSMIFMKHMDSNPATIDIGFLPTGAYLLKIKNKKGGLLKAMKLMKE